LLQAVFVWKILKFQVHCSPAKDAVNPTRRQSAPPSIQLAVNPNRRDCFDGAPASNRLSGVD